MAGDEPFIGEIFMGGFNFAPRNFAFCNGQLLSIAQNTALFSILGTTYGGNGIQTFGLPNLQGRVPIHSGQGPGLSNYSLGQTGGTETVTLSLSQIPTHNHAVQSSNLDGTLGSPVGNFFAGPGADRDLLAYNAATSGTTAVMNSNAVSNTGGNQPHNNLMPFQAINYFITLQGIFPSRN